MTQEASNTAPDTGRMVDSAITVRDFMTKKDATIFGAQHEPGHILWLGQIIGEVRDMKEKIVAQPGGDQTRSVEFSGYVESFNYHTQQKKNAPAVYLPGAISNEMEMVLLAEKRENPAANVAFAIEVGIEATGKTIPYAWRVRAFHKQTVDPLAAIRSLIPPPPKASPAIENKVVPLIEGTVTAPVAEPDPATAKESSKKKLA